MVRIKALAKERFITAKTYKFDLYSFALFPFISALPAVLIVVGIEMNGKDMSLISMTSTFEYINFILIGTLFFNFVESVWSFVFSLRYYMRTGEFEGLFCTPLTNSEIIIGLSVYPLVKVIIGSIPLFLFLLIFNISSITTFTVFVSMIVFTLSLICSYSIAFLLFSLTLVYKDGKSIVSMLGNIAPLFSGLYFSVSILPEYVKYVAMLFPFTYSLELLRNVIIGTEMLFDFHVEMIILIIMTFIYAISCKILFTKVMIRAREKGFHSY